MRTLKELYLIVLEELQTDGYSTFICTIIEEVFIQNKITNEEHKLLLAHFAIQRPTSNLYPEFYNNEHFDKTRLSMYRPWFFTCNQIDASKPLYSIQERIDIRVKLLNTIIANLD